MDKGHSNGLMEGSTISFFIKIILLKRLYEGEFAHDR